MIAPLDRPSQQTICDARETLLISLVYRSIAVWSYGFHVSSYVSCSFKVSNLKFHIETLFLEGLDSNFKHFRVTSKLEGT